MKPITYLCFTLLSVVIQFCLVDFINGRTGTDMSVDLNSTIEKNLSNIFKKFKQKPHALYYRTEGKKFHDINNIKYNNYSLAKTSFTTSTEITSSIFDLLYDDNVSLTDRESTTEMFYTSTDFDNVTEITFFDKKTTTTKPNAMPKKISRNKCYCNLLYKTCDINCCCDNDCSDMERSMSKDCKESAGEKCETNREYIDMCNTRFRCNKQLQSDIFGYLFCIEKVNMPKTPVDKNTLYFSDIEYNFKWHVTNKKRSDNIEYTKGLYAVGQPIWVVSNDTINLLELPVTITNEYCNGYKAIQFLRNENVKCYVKLKDLHMLDVMKNVEQTNIASPKDSTINATKMDCTTMHCINWTLLVCEEHKCITYDSEIHEPSCSESYCKNIAVKIEYELYCNTSLITRVVVNFHVRIVSMAFQFVTQEITVNFYMGNNSIDNIVKFSGNPGYIRGLPVIVSLSENNRTEHFLNSSFGKRNHLLLPINKDGRCVLTNITNNILKFGANIRMKCRAYFTHNFTIHNGTDGCLNIQAKIEELYGLADNIFISPYGNPQDVSDKNWIHLNKFNKSNIYGEYRPKDSQLLCYNLITRIGFVFVFADIGENKEENKILSARVESTTKNTTLYIEDLSIVITVDVNFFEGSKALHVSANTPHLNFYLPKDFFLLLDSNKCSNLSLHVTVLYLCIYNFMLSK